MARVCDSCGARIESDADRCPLCGRPVSDREGDVEPDGRSGPEGVADAEDALDCPSCGRTNPAGARFCNQCGSRLGPGEKTPVSGVEGTSVESVVQGESIGRSDEGESNQYEDLKRRVLWLVGVGVFLVAGLYMATALSSGGSSAGGGIESGGAPTGGPAQTPTGGTGSSDTEQGGGTSVPGAGSGGEAAASETGAGELDARVRARADSLRREIESAGAADRRRSLREELVRVYVHAERYDRAGSVQEQIASAAGTADAWAQAGNYYYDWMMRTSGAARTEYAQRAITAYQRSLELDPDDLDVRTDMAVAYLYDPENPMEAIRQTNRVLEEDPDHVQANFNRGVMLLQIGRSDQAVDQFRRVMELTPDTSIVHQRAQQALQRVQSS